MNEQTIRKHEQHPSWGECAPCGEWFTSDRAFDAHLGPIPEKSPPVWKHPSLVRIGGKPLSFDLEYGVWHEGGRSVA